MSDTTEQKDGRFDFMALVKNRILGKPNVKDGRSELDNTPLTIPIGFGRPETLAEQIARLIRHSDDDRRARSQEDTPDYDEDWEDDDDQPFSPYELVYDPILNQDVTIKEFFANKEVYRKKYAVAAALHSGNDDPATTLPRTPKGRPSASPQAKATRPQKAGVAEADPVEDLE